MPSGLETTLVVIAWVYAAVLGAWVAARLTLGDRPHLLFYVNAIAHVAFLPAPLLLAFAFAISHVGLTIAGVLASLVWYDFWLAPLVRGASRPHLAFAGPTLRVATFNSLWVNEDNRAVVDTIRSLDADIVALQEITPLRSALIETELKLEYPYRLLHPRPKAFGTGLLSRVPLTPSSDLLPDPDWIGDPVIANLDVADHEVSVICCHAAPVKTAAVARERQARLLVEYTNRLNRPCIILGDFNTTTRNVAYRILTRGLRDAWRDAGRGFGHTFPGPAWARAAGDGLPPPLRRLVPHWLIRIDYVFVTRHWRVCGARTARVDGSSDHRPVVAELNLP